MRSVPLIRACWIEPFLRHFRDLGAPIGLCVRDSVNGRDCPESDLPCPSRFVFACIDQVENRLGRGCGYATGLEVGEQTGIHGLGAFGQRVADEPTLGDAIRTASRLWPSIHSERTLELSRRGGRARLSSRLDETRLTPTAWEDGFVVSVLIDLVRLVGGADWRPDSVTIQSDAEKHRDCGGVPGGPTIQAGADATVIEFPATWLDRRLPKLPGQRSRTNDPDPFPVDLVGRAELVLEFLLRQGEADIDGLAAMIGVSRRTLQRHLQQRGQTYARLLEQVRLQLARRMLAESSINVIEVAFEVGYSDPSHFSRAFRRWTGVAPSTYRSELPGSFAAS